MYHHNANPYCPHALVPSNSMNPVSFVPRGGLMHATLTNENNNPQDCNRSA